MIITLKRATHDGDDIRRWTASSYRLHPGALVELSTVRAWDLGRPHPVTYARVVIALAPGDVLSVEEEPDAQTVVQVPYIGATRDEQPARPPMTDGTPMHVHHIAGTRCPACLSEVSKWPQGE